MTIYEYADAMNLRLVAERRIGFPAETSWFAFFNGVDVVEPPVLIGVSGDGRTPDAAIRNYASAISGKRIRIGPHYGGNGDHERRVEVPDLVG